MNMSSVGLSCESLATSKHFFLSSSTHRSCIHPFVRKAAGSACATAPDSAALVRTSVQSRRSRGQLTRTCVPGFVRAPFFGDGIYGGLWCARCDVVCCVWSERAEASFVFEQRKRVEQSLNSFPLTPVFGWCCAPGLVRIPPSGALFRRRARPAGFVEPCLLLMRALFRPERRLSGPRGVSCLAPPSSRVTGEASAERSSSDDGLPGFCDVRVVPPQTVRLTA
jgi:hypothetical protein